MNTKMIVLIAVRLKALAEEIATEVGDLERTREVPLDRHARCVITCRIDCLLKEQREWLDQLIDAHE